MDLDLECFRFFFFPAPLFICMLKRFQAIVGTERGKDGSDREVGECRREKGGKAEINTGLIDSI